MKTKIVIEGKDAPTVIGAIIEAAATLGRAREKLSNLGWWSLATDCQAAVEGLKELTIYEE